MNFSIIIPVYFEEDNILSELEEIKKKVKTTYEIIVVYDLDNDPTVGVVEKYIKKNKSKNIFLKKNNIGSKRGVINAVKTGIYYAKTKIIVVSMADLSDDIGKIDKMYNLIERGFDIVCASRYMKGGRQIGGPFLKNIFSRLAGISLFYLGLPTHDPTNAFKMYRKSIFSRIKILSDGGFEYSLEVIIKAHKKGLKIAEVPATWRDRAVGKSKFKLLKWLPKYLRWYWYCLSSPRRRGSSL
ncbi:MAG: glycosyl transferase, family 2 [uncultured bacterium]|nr:MAG: glycosyl transferase, family 2 [uncultured bacterium]